MVWNRKFTRCRCFQWELFLQDVYKDSGLKRKGNDFPLREVLHVSQHSRQLWLQQQPFKLRKGVCLGRYYCLQVTVSSGICTRKRFVLQVRVVSRTWKGWSVLKSIAQQVLEVLPSGHRCCASPSNCMCSLSIMHASSSLQSMFLCELLCHHCHSYLAARHPSSTGSTSCTCVHQQCMQACPKMLLREPTEEEGGYRCMAGRLIPSAMPLTGSRSLGRLAI